MDDGRCSGEIDGGDEGRPSADSRGFGIGGVLRRE
jgi:hypothetical protein